MAPIDPHDPRVYLAERTFLAWLRTGHPLMGFGLIAARFALIIRKGFGVTFAGLLSGILALFRFGSPV